jgi:hypothetical protein
MTPVFCKIKGRLYWIGELPRYGSCTLTWISRYTGIDPDNVKNIEQQPERWLVTLVNP